MPRAVHARNRQDGGEPTITPAESAITIAAALEMLVLVGGLMWAVNVPPGASLWPRILLVSAIAIVVAVIAVLACAPLFRKPPYSGEPPESPPDSGVA